MAGDEFQVLMGRMDDGFNGVFGKLDDFREQYVSHKEICGNRFMTLEQAQAIRDALNGQNKEAAKESRDWGKVIVRSALGALSAFALSVAWGIITGNIKITVG